MLIDTHCHLDFSDFDKDRKEVLNRAGQSGVKYILNISSDLASNLKTLELADAYSQVYAVLGIHPHSAKDVDSQTLNKIGELAKDNKKVVAIGEIGLDFFKNFSSPETQRKIFNEFLELAKDLSLSVVIHCRNAQPEILDIFKKKANTFFLRGVFHCFSGDQNFLKEILDLGFHVSFTANITYPNAQNLRELVKETPIERILLETDCPFLSPQAKRGQRNEPAYLTYVAEEIAGLKGLSREDVSRITGLNACQLFRLPYQESQARVTYPIRDSLYLNITNRCTDNCSFCVRFYTDYVKGHNLKLSHEPSTEEIIKELKDVSGYKEVVFCGYGEPLLRLDVVRAVAGFLKDKGAHVRLNTNGQGNLIHKRNIIPELKGLIDEVSISLNVDTEGNYNKICLPQFGPGTFGKVKEFVSESKKYIGKVSVTFIDLPEVNLKECERLAKEELGVEFRVRKLHQVG
jgi:TatD DNase family protein